MGCSENACVCVLQLHWGYLHWGYLHCLKPKRTKELKRKHTRTGPRPKNRPSLQRVFALAAVLSYVLEKESKAMVPRVSFVLLFPCFLGFTMASAASPSDSSISTNIDAAALILFHKKVTRDPYGALHSWTTSNGICSTWFGIVCNDDGRVICVLLPEKLLEGTVTIFLKELTFLENLNLSGNRMSGYFPQMIVNLPHLAHLDISSNDFDGIIDQPPSLRDFKFANNPHLQIVHSRNVKEPHWTPIVEILMAAVTLSLIFSLSCYYWRKWQYKNFQKEENKSMTVQSSSVGILLKEPAYWAGFQFMHIRKFGLKQLTEATRNFSKDCLVGNGGFGTVYRATLENGEIVALKRAYKESVQVSDEFQNEVKLLSRVHHKHLVNLIGFCEESYEQILVYEFIQNGSLLEHLSGEREPLTWRQRVRIAIGAAKGLSYLHEGCSPSIIHRDIKPSNILLDFDYEAKVSDFGLSKHGPTGDESHVSTLVKGTFGYLDPHYYLSFHLTTSSDVYSFGVILLQLVTARPAVDHSRKRSQYNIISWASASIVSGRLEDIIDSSLVEKGYDRSMMLRIARLGLRCTCKDVKLRPTISSISQELEAALRDHDKMMTINDKISPPAVDYSSPQLTYSDFVSPLSM